MAGKTDEVLIKVGDWEIRKRRPKKRRPRPVSGWRDWFPLLTLIVLVAAVLVAWYFDPRAALALLTALYLASNLLGKLRR